MKKILLTTFLFFDILVLAQPAKDSLLEQDHVQVVEMLKLMHYLDGAVMDYLRLDVAAANELDKDFPAYFRLNILAGGPVPAGQILSYLGYNQNALPRRGYELSERVAGANATALLSIIDNYGFPSFARLRKYLGKERNYGAGIFIDRSPANYKKEFKARLKKEYKLKNISANEYELYMAFAKGNGGTVDESSEFVKKMDKKGLKLIPVEP